MRRLSVREICDERQEKRDADPNELNIHEEILWHMDELDAAKTIALARYPFSNLCRSILPVPVFGNSSKNSTMRGYLYGSSVALT